MTHESRSRRMSAVLTLGLLVAGGSLVGLAQAIDQQVALSIELLELSVGEWTELNAAAGSSGDEQARAAAVEAVRTTYERLRNERYASYATSAPEHLAFFAKHAPEVEEYLAEHPELKGRIEELSQAIRNLIAAGESAGRASAEAAK